MINHTYINRFKEGDVISDFYVINDIRRASTKQECPYLSASLSDASGSVRMISANAQQQTSVEKLVDAMPEIIDKVKEVLPKKKDEETDTEV